MKVQEMSKPAMLAIEAAGLLITAALLFVIASALKLSLWLGTAGVLSPGLGVLAFGFLYYVGAAFVSAGTRDRPASPGFVLANVALHAVFLGAAWLLWRARLSGAWLGFGLALATTVHAGVCLAARYRARLIGALLQWPAARPAAAVESLFHAHTAPYRAIPLGAGLGALLVTVLRAPAAEPLRLVAVGVFAALALDALRRLLLGGAALARELLVEADVVRVQARAHSSDATSPLRVLVPSAASEQARLEAANVAAAIRRVLLTNQLPRVMVAALALSALARLSLPQLPLPSLVVALLLVALGASVECYRIGQSRTNRRLLGGGLGADPAAPSSLAPVSAWGAVAAALVVGVLAARCALPVVLELLHAR
ncbi:MAG TPA: hypothetical protein VFZ61_20545 [Polyangiales bacterium]